LQHVFRHTQEGIELRWNARNHRKRRSHPLKTADGAYAARARYRFLALQWRLLSWWVAAVFTVGSLVWLINGLVSVLPFSEEPMVKTDVPIWTAVLGGGIFLIGAYLSWLEVLNAPRFVLLFRDDNARHSRALHADGHRIWWFGFKSDFENLMLSNLTTFLGSCCFLIASYLMLVEIINPEGPEGR